MRRRQLITVVIALVAFAGLTAAYQPEGFHRANNAALNATSTVGVNYVIRDGYATPGDVAPLVFKASNSACSLNAGDGDGGSQVKSANNKCWIAVFHDDKANVKEFGAKGDGVTDDGPAFRAACAWALSSAGSSNPIYVPAGTYLFNTLDADGGAALYLNTGANDNAACSLSGPTSGFDIFSPPLGPASLKLGNGLNRPLLRHRVMGASSRLSNLTLDGNKANQTGWVGGPDGGRLFIVQEDNSTFGIDSTPETGIIMNDVVMQNGYNGNQYVGSARYTWWDRAWSMFSGQNTTDCSVAVFGYDSVFNLPAIGSNAGCGLLLQEGSQYTIYSGAMWSNGTCGLQIGGLQVNYASIWGTNFQLNDKGVCNTNDAAFASSSAGGITLTGVSFESNTTRDVDVSAGGQINRQMKLVSPTFVGCIGVGCSPPPYNISATGNVVEVVNPNLGSNGAYGTAFSDTPTNVFCTGSACPSTAFTPTIVGNTVAGTPTYTLQTGYVTRNGSMVHMQFAVTTSNLGGATGSLYIGGSPWFARTLTGYIAGCSLAGISGWTAPAGYDWLTAGIQDSDNKVFLWRNSKSGSSVALANAAEFGATSGFSGSCDYIGSN